jgi:uncharacterized damage-inducible protein DinB
MKIYLYGAITLMALGLSGVFPASAAAQEPETKETPAKKEDPAKLISPTAGFLQVWNDVGQKLIAMAEDFPEDKFDYQPMAGTRTFREAILHAGGTVYYFQAILAGQAPPEGPKAENYKDRAALTAYLKKAIADGSAMIEKLGDAGFSKPMLIGAKHRESNPYGTLAHLCEHSGEHYGQLVVYYRANGLVPPGSRPKK